jgi:hypothetical protein
MATLAETVTARAAAATTYAAACEAFVAAWVELNAYDRVLSARSGDLAGFGDQPTVPQHHLALPNLTTPLRDPAGQSTTRANQLNAALSS